jgi:hypothetical protein
MATQITAGNATNNGVKIDSDNTGALQIKTGSGAGTTAIDIDASQNVVVAGSLTATGGFVGGGGNYAMNAYASPATWTKPAGLKAVKVTVVGAGGNGFSTPAGTSSATAGGGGGGAAIDYIPAPSIPGPVAVTAGPGTNSFGAFCSATAGATGAIQVGGAGGVGTGGTVNFTGSTAGPFQAQTGGSSLLGGSVAGGSVTSPTNNSVGFAGLNYGGGGGGAPATGSAGTRTGGAGAPGIVIVEEFY